MKFTIIRFPTIDSTNSEAANQAKRGAAEGVCVVADEQSSGRGRHGRQWISAKDAGLFFSVVLRPRIDMRFFPLLTFVGAISVFEALSETFSLSPDIKWANDVLIGGQKISGILAEAVETDLGIAVILGIGINLRSDHLPSELRRIATSIETQTGETPDKELLLESLTRQISKFYDLIKSPGGDDLIRKAWVERSSYAFGKPVRVKLDNETILGNTAGIEPNGALRIAMESGEIRIVNTGEVEKLRTESAN